MEIKSNSKITGLGAYLPEKILNNHDFESMVETNDEWIVRRTGVRERHISAKNEYASDMAIKAVENLIEKYNVRVDDVDMIIVTTFTPDHLSPTVSAMVQGHFGINGTGTMDLNSGCTGFVYGLCVADSLITSGRSNKVLVIASETISKVVDYSDRNTCILFGDAAAASLIERQENKGNFLVSGFSTDGKLGDNVSCSNFSDNIYGRLVGKNRIFQQVGKFVYEYVIKNVPNGIRNLLKKANMTLDDINWFVPHSANLRMVEALCEKLNFSINKTLVSNEFFGNTSSVSIPLAIWKALCDLKIKAGDTLLLYGFGGGLTHGGLVITW